MVVPSFDQVVGSNPDYQDALSNGSDVVCTHQNTTLKGVGFKCILVQRLGYEYPNNFGVSRELIKWSGLIESSTGIALTLIWDATCMQIVRIVHGICYFDITFGARTLNFFVTIVRIVGLSNDIIILLDSVIKER